MRPGERILLMLGRPIRTVTLKSMALTGMRQPTRRALRKTPYFYAFRSVAIRINRLPDIAYN